MSIFAKAAFVPAAWWVICITVVTWCLLLRSKRLLHGSTLIGPWWWMVASISVMGGTQSILLVASQIAGRESAHWEAALVFAAASSSFCPLMSLLGAKRPQDRGWHFVVLSLWAILILPVAESLVLRHGQMPDVQGARSWFMLILIALGITNFLPTRFGIPAALFGIGQLLMLADSLPLIRDFFDSSPTVTGFSCCATANIVASALGSRRNARPRSLDRVWRDFRDAFGLLWGLRVAEQINIAARSSKWPLTLRWWGFVGDDGSKLDFDDLPDETQKPLLQVTQNLLRRFVSSNWIAARLGDGIDLGID